jgi:hypothetical protein
VLQTQAPLLQVALAPQAVPHEPQFLGSALVLTQVPAQHTCPDAQTLPHPPQLLGLVAVSMQLPLQQVPEPPLDSEQAAPFCEVLATQVPLLQVWQVVHVPQEMVPPQPSDPVPQVCPPVHAVEGVQPQTFGVPPPPQVCGDLQLPQLSVPPQPLEMVPQVACCAAQVVGVQQVPLLQTWPDEQQLMPHVAVEEAQAHFPFVHVWFAPQTVPQAPQLWVSEAVLTQVPAQQVPLAPPPSLQLPPEPGWQVPLLQVWQVGQLPHESVPPQPSGTDPQVAPCAAQLVGVQQTPLLHTWPEEQHEPPQATVEAGQAHRPFVQVCVTPQIVPQLPQLLESEEVLIQAPAQQVVPVGHLWPQLPQLLLLVWRSTQVPEQFVPVLQRQIPPVQVEPLQQGLLALQLPPAATHLVVGAAVERPDDAVAADADIGVGLAVEAGVAVGVESAAASVRPGNIAPAIPAATIFRAFRRESGRASFLASSSKRSALMPLCSWPVALPCRIRRAPLGAL